MKPISHRPLILILGLSLMGLGHAAAWAGDIPWSSLSADEQRTLSKARKDWDQLPTERQQRLLSGARRWQEMNPQQREQARDNWKQRRQDSNNRR